MSFANVHVSWRFNLRVAVLGMSHFPNRPAIKQPWLTVEPTLPSGPYRLLYVQKHIAAPYLRQPFGTPALKSLLRTSAKSPKQPKSPPVRLIARESGKDRNKRILPIGPPPDWELSFILLRVERAFDPDLQQLPMLARRALQLRWQSLRGPISLPNQSGACWTTTRLYSSAAPDAAWTQGSGRPIDGVATGADSAIPIAAKMGLRAPPPPSGQNSSASSQASKPFQRTAQIARHLNSNSDSSSPPAKMSGYTVRKVAAQNTLEHRVYIEKDGIPVSPFHDIPLFANQEQTILNMVVEIPRWTNGKLEVSSQLQQLTRSGLNWLPSCLSSETRAHLVSILSIPPFCCPSFWAPPFSAY